MKITKQRIKEIIKEELSSVLKEGEATHDPEYIRFRTDQHLHDRVPLVIDELLKIWDVPDADAPDHPAVASMVVTALKDFEERRSLERLPEPNRRFLDSYRPTSDDLDKTLSDILPDRVEKLGLPWYWKYAPVSIVFPQEAEYASRYPDPFDPDSPDYEGEL